MSSTLKAAIESAKARVAEAYDAIEEKGGTLPTTQDLANLPQAIEDLPSGGGGAYDYLSQLGFTEASVSVLNEYNDVKVTESEGGTTTPFIHKEVCPSNYAASLKNNQKVDIVSFDSYDGVEETNMFYQGLMGSSVRIFISKNGAGISKSGTKYYMFSGCKNLRAIFGTIDMSEGVKYVSQLNGCSLLEYVLLKNIDFPMKLNQCTLLKYDCLFYAVQNLANVSGFTLTLGSTNIEKLNATEEGAAAIAAAQEMGWTIA